MQNKLESPSPNLLINFILGSRKYATMGALQSLESTLASTGSILSRLGEKLAGKPAWPVH